MTPLGTHPTILTIMGLALIVGAIATFFWMVSDRIAEPSTTTSESNERSTIAVACMVVAAFGIVCLLTNPFAGLVHVINQM